MAYLISHELLDYYNFYIAWQQWARRKPSRKHPIKYIKWWFSEPQYETFIKENNK